MAASQKQSQCHLKTEILEQTKEVLKFKWVLENRGTSNVFVFHRLYSSIEKGGSYQTSPDLVYVECNAREVKISKKIFPVPDDIDVEIRIIPCASVVKPGDRFSETVTVRLPLELASPYPGRLRSSDQIETRPAWFELGTITLPPEGEKLAESVATPQGPAVHFSNLRADQQVLVRSRLADSVPFRLPQKPETVK